MNLQHANVSKNTFSSFLKNLIVSLWLTIIWRAIIGIICSNDIAELMNPLFVKHIFDGAC